MSEMNSFQDAFYIMAKELGFDYAQPLSPREVFETQMLPRIRELVAAHPAAGDPVYQLRNTVANIGWRDADKEAYDSAANLAKYERRILWTVLPATAHGDDAPGTVRVTADWLKKVHRDLDACQKVIWLAGCRPHVPGGFDPAYCEDAQARLKEIDEQIARALSNEKVQR